jgi:hypothetical protein
VNIIGKLAVGNTHEVINLTGNTTMTSAAGATVTVPGGLLVVRTNTGLFSRDEFTFLPEAQVKVGVHVTRNLSAYVGYSMIYWFDVARPGEQFDRGVNPILVPSNLAFTGAPAVPARPISIFQKSDFWTQGINFGLELRF